MRIFIKTSPVVRALLCALALSCSTLASSALAQEVVVNGGFESGSFSPGWTFSDSSGFTNVGSDPAFANSGTFHANLGAEGVLGSLSQTLNTTPGGAYTLSFWLANDSGVGPNEFDVFWNGAPTPISLTAQPAFDYTEFTLSVVATGASTSLEFRYRNDDDFFRLDDVSVTPVPEPSVNWLILPGLGMLCLVRYRSAKRRRLSALV